MIQQLFRSLSQTFFAFEFFISTIQLTIFPNEPIEIGVATGCKIDFRTVQWNVVFGEFFGLAKAPSSKCMYSLRLLSIELLLFDNWNYPHPIRFGMPTIYQPKNKTVHFIDFREIRFSFVSLAQFKNSHLIFCIYWSLAERHFLHLLNFISSKIEWNNTKKTSYINGMKQPKFTKEKFPQKWFHTQKTTTTTNLFAECATLWKAGLVITDFNFNWANQMLLLNSSFIIQYSLNACTLIGACNWFFFVEIYSANWNIKL